MHTRNLSAVCSVVLLAALLAGCGGDGGAAPSSAAPLTSAMVLQGGPASVGVTTMTFVDPTRPTMASGSFPGAPTRMLVTEVWYPAEPGLPALENRDAPLAHAGRPFPFIVYSHGFMSVRTGGAFLARKLASYGYVVAAPDFPLTNASAAGGHPNVLDVVNQPADVSFVIDRLLALVDDSRSPFAATIDPGRIGLTGLSLGGMTTFLAAFHPTLRDPRVRAAAPIAGPGCFFGPRFYDDLRLPSLLLYGDIDAIVPYAENAVFAFGEANPPKYLVTVVGGSHTGFTDGGEFFDNVNNPDDVGCFALRGTLPSDQSFLGELGGADAGIIGGDCPLPCSGPTPRPRAIRPSRQQQLTILSIVPFFDASLRGSERAQRFLETTLVAENPDLQVQFQH